MVSRKEPLMRNKPVNRLCRGARYLSLIVCFIGLGMVTKCFLGAQLHVKGLAALGLTERGTGIDVASGNAYDHAIMNLHTMEEVDLASADAKFYLYAGSDFNVSNILNCYRDREGVDIWRHEKEETAQNTAEVWLYHRLLDHPNRTEDPVKAKVFIVPVFPFTSWFAGWCNGTNNWGRMKGLSWSLRTSPYFQKHGGADHLFVCQWWKCRDALGTLREELDINVRSLLAIHEMVQFWGGWRCPQKVVLIPYVANTKIIPQNCTTPTSKRDISFFFIGCSRWKEERRNVNALRNIQNSFVVVQWNCSDFIINADQYSELICRSKFCLIPRGDTFTSRRFYDSIAGGCIPVVQQEGSRQQLPFSWKLDYSKFSVFVPSELFYSPSALYNLALRLIAMPANHVNTMQKELFKAQKELLYGHVKTSNVTGVEVATSVLEESNVADNLVRDAFATVEKGLWRCGAKWDTHDAEHIHMPERGKVYVDEKHNITFCDIPDSGGVVFRSLTEQLSGGKIKFKPVQLTRKRVEDLYMDPAYVKVTMVRHPVLRLLATYMAEKKVGIKDGVDQQEFTIFLAILSKNRDHPEASGDRYLQQVSHCGLAEGRHDFVIKAESLQDDVIDLMESMSIPLRDKQAQNDSESVILSYNTREEHLRDTAGKVFTTETLRTVEWLYQYDTDLLRYNVTKY